MIDIFLLLWYNERMDYIFNKEKIEKVLSDFYSSTSIAATLYDASETIVAKSPTYAGFCSYIRINEACVKNCDNSNLIHMKEVARNRKIHCYTCHAGLMEAILPIQYENVLIAFLQIGQFRDAEEVYSSPKKMQESPLCDEFDRAHLLSLYENIPIVSKEKLEAVCDIMEILIKHFWVEGLIHYNRSMISVRIEQYITDHFAENLCVTDLCREFLLSKNALYQLFRDEFDTTVNSFIIQKRIHAAKELLTSSPMLNITQVATRCGFTDYNYFIRLFKKQEGITPLQYRKRNQMEK